MTSRITEHDAGPIGRLVDRLFLERYLTGLLVQRNQWLVAARS